MAARRGLTGAPALAALATARAGAGYVTVAVPDSLVEILAIKLLEVMQVGLPERDGALAPAAVVTALERAQRVQSVVLGPGLGREPGAQTFARELARAVPVPLVLDADGLGAHAGDALSALSGRPAATVLTPHAGELGRLLALDSSEVDERRLACVCEAARRAGGVVVLKGDDTLVADPGGRVAVSAGNAPALATAGTGDVLSGVIAARSSRRVWAVRRRVRRGVRPCGGGPSRRRIDRTRGRDRERRHLAAASGARAEGVGRGAAAGCG